MNEQIDTHAWSDEDEDGGPRRYLIAAAVAHYPKSPAWDRPDLLEARERVVRLFTGDLGYRYYAAVEVDPTKTQLLDALNAFCDSPLRREDDLLAVYLSCHGEVLDDGGEHVLFTTDTDPHRLAYTGLPTAELVRAMLRGTRIRRVLLVLDACYAAAGGNQLAAAALEQLGTAWGRSSGSGLVVVSSAQPHQQAAAGLFPRLLQDAVASLSVAGHGPGSLALDAVVQHIKNAPARPDYQRVSLAMVGLDGEIPAFLPNPRHQPQLAEVDLAIQQAAAFDEQDRRRETELVSRLLVRAMGYHGDAQIPAWWFTGRHTALHDLAAWLDAEAGGDQAVCRVVTGNPGSGKTAVLGLIATLSDSERRRTVPLDALVLPEDLIGPDALDVAVYAQRLTDSDVLTALSAAARVHAGTVGELLEALNGRAHTLTVLVDALDEAATPESLCATTLRPILEHAHGRIRLLLGTRPYLLPRLGLSAGHDAIVDLDSERYADPQALRAYTMRTLLDAHRTSPYRQHLSAARSVAAAVAEAAGTSFLVARIAAGTLAAADTVVDNPHAPAWRAALPRHASAAMRDDLHRRLGQDAQRAVDLLRPLAYAQGQGLPWEDLWAPLASEIAGHAYTDDDLLWLRRTAGSYIVEATENGRSAYRLYHQAMAEHLRDGVNHHAVHAAYTRVLTDRVPYRVDGTRDWSRAHPYTLAHLGFHADQAGLLDQILNDSDYLVHAEPRGLTPYLHRVRSDEARLTAAVYRTSLGLHHNAAPAQRRQILDLDAARAGARALHQHLIEHVPAGEWATVWATGSGFTPHLRHTLTGHSGWVSAVACTEIGQIPVAVTGGKDGSVRVWDLRTGHLIGQPMTSYSGEVSAVACTEVDGVPVAVTGSDDGSVRLWDLDAGRPLGQPLTGHSREVCAVACTEIGQIPVAVTGGYDGSVRVWDLRTGHPVGQPMTGHSGRVCAVSCMPVDGVPVAVTGSYDGSVRVWDLRTGHPVGQPMTSYSGEVSAVACTEVDGVPVAIKGSQDSQVQIWDLRLGRAVERQLAGHWDKISAVACTEADGVPVAIAGRADGSVRVWDLRTGHLIGQPMTGHSSRVSAAACTVLDGAPVAVTGSDDGSVRVWDLRAGQPVGQPMTGPSGGVSAVACTEVNGMPVAVTGSGGMLADHSVWVQNVRTGQPVGQPMTGHIAAVSAVACTVVDGVPVAVTRNGSAMFGATVLVWDLRTGQRIRTLADHADKTSAVACTETDQVPVAVTGGKDRSVRVWDLRTGHPVGQPMTGHSGWVSAVACTVLDGAPVAVTGGQDGSVRVWDLRTGHPAREPMTGHSGWVSAVACTEIDQVPVAVTGGDDGSVRVWDLAAGRPAGQLLTSRSGSVLAVACTVLDGVPVAVTGGQDGSVRVWDLRAQAQTAHLVLDQPQAIALTTVGDLVVGFRHDVAVFRRQPHPVPARTDRTS